MKATARAIGLAALIVTGPAIADDTRPTYQFTCIAFGAVETQFHFDGTSPTTQFFANYGRGPYLLQLLDLNSKGNAGNYWTVLFQPKNKSQNDISFGGMYDQWRDLFIKKNENDVTSIEISIPTPPGSFELAKDDNDYKFQYVTHILSSEKWTRDYNIRYGKQSEAGGFTSTIVGRCVRDQIVSKME